MKYQKSSQSLHCDPSSILREYSSNTCTPSVRVQWRTATSYRKEFSSTFNARARLNSLREQMQALQEQSREVQLLNKEMGLEIGFIREQYCERQLQETSSVLGNLVKELRKKVVIGRRSDLLKYESLQNIVDAMGRNHRELEGKVAAIEERVTALENVMGTNSLLRSKLMR